MSRGLVILLVKIWPSLPGEGQSVPIALRTATAANEGTGTSVCKWKVGNKKG